MYFYPRWVKAIVMTHEKVCNSSNGTSLTKVKPMSGIKLGHELGWPMVKNRKLIIRVSQKKKFEISEFCLLE